MLAAWIVEQLAEDPHLKGGNKNVTRWQNHLQAMGGWTDYGHFQAAADGRSNRRDRRLHSVTLKAGGSFAVGAVFQIAKEFLHRDQLGVLSPF